MRISKEHGLNPSIVTCFWCGESRGDIVLFGASYPKGERAPMNVITGYDPCDKCAEGFAIGVLLMEAQNSPIADRPPMQHGVWPTGRYAVVKEEAIHHVFSPDAAKNILKHRRAFVDTSTYEQLLGDYSAE